MAAEALDVFAHRRRTPSSCSMQDLAQPIAWCRAEEMRVQGRAQGRLKFTKR